MDGNKQKKDMFPIKERKQFFQIMDQVERYDQQITGLNEFFGQAMLSLSNLHFINPYSSINTNGYKPTPALLKYNDQIKQLQFGYSPFCLNPSNQQQQTYEQQRQIQQQTRKLMERNDLQNQQKIINRFGSTSNQREIILASQKFRKVLNQILKIAETKKQIEEKFNTIK